MRLQASEQNSVLRQRTFGSVPRLDVSQAGGNWIVDSRGRSGAVVAAASALRPAWETSLNLPLGRACGLLFPGEDHVELSRFAVPPLTGLQ